MVQRSLGYMGTHGGTWECMGHMGAHGGTLGGMGTQGGGIHGHCAAGGRRRAAAKVDVQERARKGMTSGDDISPA